MKKTGYKRSYSSRSSRPSSSGVTAGQMKAILKEIVASKGKPKKRVKKRKTSSSLFEKVGRGVGTYFGSPDVGASVGRLVHKVVGVGDYTSERGSPVVNQLFTSSLDKPLQVMPAGGAPANSGDVVITHREFITNVSATTVGHNSPFAIRTFPINAGLGTFPFLSQIASNFEMYRFEGLVFEYRPIFGEGAGTSNSLGKVIMATNYDPYAEPFETSQVMQNYDYASSCKPSVQMFHGVETDRKSGSVNMSYVRSGTSTKDLMFTDVGNFYIASEGIAGSFSSTQIIGELWVSYTCRLSRAKLWDSVGLFNSGAYDRFGIVIGPGNASGSSAIDIVTASSVGVLKGSTGRWKVFISSGYSGYASTRDITFGTDRNISQGAYRVVIRSVSSGTPADTFGDVTWQRPEDRNLDSNVAVTELVQKNRIGSGQPDYMAQFVVRITNEYPGREPRLTFRIGSRSVAANTSETFVVEFIGVPDDVFEADTYPLLTPYTPFPLTSGA